MKDYGEIPGGKNYLKDILYPFERNYPKKLWSQYRWNRNKNLKNKISVLNENSKWITVIDRLGAPGDALITANVIQGIKKTFPKLKINCITPHPNLIELDPNIDSINKKETFYSFDSTYWELIVRKERKQNIVSYNLNRLGIKGIKYKAKFYLSNDEIDWAKDVFAKHKKPIIAICSKSKEQVKNWPTYNWEKVIDSLRKDYHIIQLGDKTETNYKFTKRYAGTLTMRESAALLSQCRLFVGPDSLLMHVANGLNVPSVIIFGGSRPIECFGYSENVNIDSKPNCSPCWIHKGYEMCDYDLICMKSIAADEVIYEVRRLSNIIN